MAMNNLRCFHIPLRISRISRSIHTSAVCCKVKAGRIKETRFKNKPITYDQAFKPEFIAHKKGWLSFHTGNLNDEEGAAQAAYEDLFLRNFFHGTFYRLLATEIVIKRRLNIIEITLFGRPKTSTVTYHFLTSYAEEFLSSFLKCNVKIHLHIVTEEEMVYKYV